MIDNPAYRGPWVPRKIPYPGYYEVKDPLKELEPMVDICISTQIGFTR